MNSACPFCGQQSLVEKTRKKVFSRGDHKVSVELLHTHCKECETEFVDEIQSRENKKRLRAREKQYEGWLTGEKILAVRRKYNLTQVIAAKLFGGGPVAFSKYENEEVLPSEAMDNLLFVAAEIPEVVYKLAERKGVDVARRVEPRNRRRSDKFVKMFDARFSYGTVLMGTSVWEAFAQHEELHAMSYLEFCKEVDFGDLATISLRRSQGGQDEDSLCAVA